MGFEERRVILYSALNGIVNICMATTLDTFNKLDINFSNFLNLPRMEFENTYLDVQNQIKEKLELSDRAISYLSLLLSSFNGIRFDDHVFDMSPLSVKTLKRLRNELEIK